MAKRIFVLINHKTYIAAIAPMLIKFGYEVYIPKIVSSSIPDLSSKVFFDYDNSLSLDKKVLKKLNSIDFYDSISLSDFNLLDQYFDVAILSIYKEKQFFDFLKFFHGITIYNAFGVQNLLTYTKIFSSNNKFCNLYELKKFINKFWFGYGYERIPEIECDLLKNNSIYLPVPFKDDENKNKWIGTERKLLFVAPKINSSVYYNRIYNEFIDNFGDFPYLILGQQFVDVDNKNVMGYLQDEEYKKAFRNCSVMFYHSTELRHLHYHPIEAISIGMPVVYMRNSLLDYIGGKDSLGRCKNIKEAKRKIKRILTGDKKYAEKIACSERKILNYFSCDYCEDYWRNAFNIILSKNGNDEKRKKIVFIMPANNYGGVFDVSIRLLLSLKKGIDENHGNIDVYFAHLKDDENDEKFDILRNNGIFVKEFWYEEVNKTELIKIVKLMGIHYSDDLYFNDLIPQKAVVIRDGGNDYMDYDRVVFLNDSAPLNYFSFVPYSVLVHDYIQRYVPDIFSKKSVESKLNFQRSASEVIVMSDTQYKDAIQYGGISKECLIKIPFLFNTKLKITKKINEDYFIWPTNVQIHKNHINSLKALENYYDKGGKIKCKITGVDTKYFLPNANIPNNYNCEYIKKIQLLINNSESLRKNIEICGNLDKQAYINYVGNSKFVFHPGYADNGNLGLIDGLALNVPGLSSKYPASQEYSKITGYDFCFFDYNNVKDIEEKLFYMEKNWKTYKSNIRKININKLSYENISDDLFMAFYKIVGKY